MAIAMEAANPFFFPGPITDPRYLIPDYFLGRQKQVEDAVERILDKRSISVIGRRLLGRTSFLHYVVYKVQERSSSTVCIYCDCAAGAEAAPDELYRLLYEELKHRLMDTHPAVALADVSAIRGFSDFKDALKVIARERISVVYVLDRFEALAENKQLKNSLFSQWRSLTTNSDVRLCFCTVSPVPLPELPWTDPEVKASTFFTNLFPIFLKLLEDVEARAMLRNLARLKGVLFDDDLITFLLDELAGPHPLLLQIAGAVAFNLARDGPVDAARRARMCHEFVEIAKVACWTTLWNQLSPLLQRYLVLLAVRQKQDAAAVDRLQTAGLILQDEAGTLRPLSRAFGRFIRGQQVEGLLQAPPIVIDSNEAIAWMCDAIGTMHEMKLERLSFKLLECLVKNAGYSVSHDELNKHMRKDMKQEKREELADPKASLKTALANLRMELGAKDLNTDPRERIAARKLNHLMFCPDALEPCLDAP